MEAMESSVMYRARRRQWGLGGDLRQLQLQSRVRFVEVRPWIGGLRRSDRAAAARHERASAMRKVWASLHPRTTHHCTTQALHRTPGGDVLLAGEPRKITDPQPLRGGTAPQPGQRSSLKLSGLIRAHTRRVSAGGAGKRGSGCRQERNLRPAACNSFMEGRRTCAIRRPVVRVGNKAEIHASAASVRPTGHGYGASHRSIVVSRDGASSGPTPSVVRGKGTKRLATRS